MNRQEIPCKNGSLKISRQVGTAIPDEPKIRLKQAAAIFICVLLTGFAACSSAPPIRFDYDAREDFHRFKTFDFFPIPEPIKSDCDPRVIQRIQQAVARELQQKGLVQTAHNPDLRIAVHTEPGTKFRVILWGYHYAPYAYYWQEDAYWNGGIDLARYPSGTLVLDLVRSDKHEMIWRGVAPQALPADTDPMALDRIVDRAVELILKNFPPRRNTSG